MSAPKFPDIEVRLSGTDGNAFAIIGAVKRGLRRGGADETEVAQFQSEAMSGDYDNVLRSAMRWVTVS